MHGKTLAKEDRHIQQKDKEDGDRHINGQVDGKVNLKFIYIL